MTNDSKSADRQARKAAAVQLFVQQYARKTRANLDPHDRSYDRRLEEEIKRMKPERLDALLRDGKDD